MKKRKTNTKLNYQHESGMKIRRAFLKLIKRRQHIDTLRIAEESRENKHCENLKKFKEAVISIWGGEQSERKTIYFPIKFEPEATNQTFDALSTVFHAVVEYSCLMYEKIEQVQLEIINAFATTLGECVPQLSEIHTPSQSQYEALVKKDLPFCSDDQNLGFYKYLLAHAAVENNNYILLEGLDKSTQSSDNFFGFMYYRGETETPIQVLMTHILDQFKLLDDLKKRVNLKNVV